MRGPNSRAPNKATFFGKLARDKRGNTLAIMAISLIPLSAMAGSVVDMGRLYLVKVRLQQACDAGVLAGRKSMVATGTTLDTAAATQAKTFFANNFPSGLMGTAAFTSTTTPYPFVPVKTADNQVSATATATVPMTITKMFNAPNVKLDVTCEARYDVADTDVMFVLDTTGSMACTPADSTAACSTYVSDPQGNSKDTDDVVTYTKPADGTGSGNLSIAGYPGSTGYYVPEKSDARIKALRLAVLSFFDTMTSTIDPTTNVRYGFVTYTSTVNAGRAIMDLSPAYMVGNGALPNWNYQTRRQTGESSSSSVTSNNVNSATCASYNSARSPATGYDTTTGTPGPKAKMVVATRSDGTCTIVTTTYLPRWTYNQYALDVSTYVTGAATTDPTRNNGTTSRWAGCIEERKTTAGATSFATASLPPDLDPDLVPTSNIDTRWRPMWPEVIYTRSKTPDSSTGDDGTNTSYASDTYARAGYVSCGKPVQRLKVMTRAAVSAYVNATDFRAIGGTYHDTGMIWGTRMLSPKGIFAGDTAAWEKRQAPNRVLIFMTDGDMQPNESIYGMYGYEALDQRVTNGNYGTFATYQNYHNQRFLAECSKAKDLGIDVWVVAVGQAVTTQLEACASSKSQAIYAGTSPDVSTAFSDIAKKIAALRISK
ncbi:pilus assembly protein TadG-related protein [Sphingomonas sp. PB4P5]|uniref:pilus assembly protein TadG-related protein n=1 Tax=Parasphingomonas puruogangriensis TaxID=3096155 RepID=UPI002FCC26EE